jgi:ankyrin repeat protein
MRDNRWGGTVPAVLFAALLSGVACFCPVLALSAPDGEIAFSEVDAGKISLVRSKLLRGADPDRVNEDGQSLLWEAAYRGEDRMVRLLLSHGADPNQADRSGKPPLYWPASDGYGRIVRLLLAYGADRSVDRSMEEP